MLSRTDELAMERTLLANERTGLAWLRTAITLVLAGVTMVYMSDGWLRWFGVAAIPFGVGLGVLGRVRYCNARRRIRGRVEENEE